MIKIYIKEGDFWKEKDTVGTMRYAHMLISTMGVVGNEYKVVDEETGVEKYYNVRETEIRMMTIEPPDNTPHHISDNSQQGPTS